MKKKHIPEFFQKGFTAIFGSKPAMIAYSVLSALLIWFILSINVYPTATKTIKGIEVTVRLPEIKSDTESDYQLQSHKVETVDIKIEANRNLIGNLTAKDFSAVVDARSMKDPGTEDFAINISCNKKIEYVIDSVSAETDTVTIDKMETKEIDVYVSAPNIKIAEGYRLDGSEGVCTPSNITISGPSLLLRQISKAQAVLDSSKEINTSYTTYTDSLKFYDENGAEVEGDGIKPSVSEFIVTFNLLTQKQLDLTYQIKNQPAEFNEAWLRDRISLSNTSIQLASKGSELDDLKTWDIGSVSLNDIGLGFSKTIKIDIPSDYENVSGTNSVTLTLDNEGLAKREISLNDIKVINPPIGYTNFNVTTDNLIVTLIGPEEKIDNISSADITASINLLGYKVQSYAFSYDVTIACSKYDDIWAYGTYKAAVSCEEEVTETETPSEAETETESKE